MNDTVDGHRNRTVHHVLRGGFTLIEVLIVITIILILTAVTIATFNYSINADRTRSAARQFQSFLAGARDKAILANNVRGVRLLVDPTDGHAVGGMQYIGSPNVESGQLVADINNTHNNVVRLPPGALNRWATLKNLGLLKVGCRLQVTSGTSTWYTVSAIAPDPTIPVPPGSPPYLMLSLNQSLLQTGPTLKYAMELGASPLGESQPVLFARGVVIDLDGSALPAKWRPSSATTSYGFPNSMDILFDSRGQIIGDCSSTGMVHFHFAESFDVAKWHADSNTSTGQNGLTGRTATTYNPASLPIVPADNNNGSTAVKVVNRDRLVATLKTKTGSVSVSYVNAKNTSPYVASPAPIVAAADDPFMFSETGQVANK